jgi:probable phosphoglycerate mutase
MVRARQTATSIHEAHPSVPFIECEDFEEINWGEWEGQPFCELDMTPYFTEWKQGNFDIATPGGESPAHVRVRLERAMKWLLEHVHDKRHVVLVAHGRLIRILLAMLLDHSLATMEQYNHHNTCVNVISCTPSDSVFGYTFTAVSLNETWHLMQYM